MTICSLNRSPGPLGVHQSTGQVIICPSSILLFSLSVVLVLFFFFIFIFINFSTVHITGGTGKSERARAIYNAGRARADAKLIGRGHRKENNRARAFKWESRRALRTFSGPSRAAWEHDFRFAARQGLFYVNQGRVCTRICVMSEWSDILRSAYWMGVCNGILGVDISRGLVCTERKCWGSFWCRCESVSKINY